MVWEIWMIFCSFLCCCCMLYGVEWSKKHLFKYAANENQQHVSRVQGKFIFFAEQSRNLSCAHKTSIRFPQGMWVRMEEFFPCSTCLKKLHVENNPIKFWGIPTSTKQRHVEEWTFSRALEKLFLLISTFTTVQNVEIPFIKREGKKCET